MFNTRGFRLSALFAVMLSMFSVLAVDTAEARRGGSFGSRGTRTQQTVPATPTAPSATSPVQRSTTAAPTANSTAPAGAAAAATQRPGWLGGGIGGAILGGLLFSGLFGLMFGAGFGGIGGLLALAVQVLVIVVLFRLFFGRRMATAGAPGNASPYAARPDWQPGGGSKPAPRPNPSAASQRAGRRDELGVGDGDLDQFQQRLAELQDAFAREDYEALRQITTPEMMGYLAEELGTNASKGLRNEVYDVKLIAGDIAEAWREGRDEYATVSLKYESRDVTRERTTGRIVSGEDRPTEVTEIWTFVRRDGGPWMVSAIQDA